MKISLGAGDYRIDGFINCDFDPNTNPDLIFDLEKDIFPFPDNSVDVVLASHVLEHLGDGYFHCLKEIYRICKHNATVHIYVPHHRSDDFFSDPTHKRPITVDGLKIFGRKYNRLSREQDVHASRLGEYYNVDFEVIDWSYRPVEEFQKEFQNKSKEEIDKFIKQYSNIVDEVYIKVVVIKDDK